MIKPDERTKQNIYALSLSFLFLVLFWWFFSNWGHVAAFFAKIGSSLEPFIYGMVIVLLSTPLRKIVEERWLAKTRLQPRTRRRVAVAVAILVFLFVIAAFFMVLTPQLVDSFTTLFSNFSTYASSFEAWVDQLTQDSQYATLVHDITSQISQYLSNLLNTAGGLVTQIVNASMQIVNGVVNFFIGVIIAIYILLDSEKFKRALKKIFYAALPKKGAEQAVRICRLTARMFYSFIFGKALDSLIIGIICAVGCTVLQIPFTVLISFIIGITNMIPFFGPFIGAIPCIFILLFIDPLKAIWFTIFIIVLQQVDGNIIGPYILGDSMGLSPILIMFAILVFGSLFGIVGMIIGVPLFAVIYVLVTELVRDQLRRKEITI